MKRVGYCNNKIVGSKRYGCNSYSVYNCIGYRIGNNRRLKIEIDGCSVFNVIIKLTNMLLQKRERMLTNEEIGPIDIISINRDDITTTENNNKKFTRMKIEFCVWIAVINRPFLCGLMNMRVFVHF